MKAKLAVLLMVFLGAGIVHVRAEIAGGSGGSSSPQTFEAICEEAERGFQNHLLTIINYAQRDFITSHECLSGSSTVSDPAARKKCGEINNTNLEQVKDYRDITAKFNKAVAKKWIAEQKELQKGNTLYDDCFVIKGGEVVLSDHSRIPEINKEILACQPLLHSYTEMLNNESHKYLASPAQLPEISADERETLLKYLKTPIARRLSSNVRHSGGMDTGAIKKELSSGYKDMAQGIDELATDLSSLGSHELYQLYEFESQYKTYLGTLDDSERRKLEGCQETRGFSTDCLALVRTLEARERCQFRTWRGLKTVLPVVNVIDAYQGLQANTAATDAGIQTEEEHVRKQSALTQQMVGGVAEVMPGAKAASMASSASRRATAASQRAAQAAAKSAAETRAINKAAVSDQLKNMTAAEKETAINALNNMPVKDMSEVQKNAMLNLTSEMPWEQRVRNSDIVLRRPLSPKEVKALEDAHLFNKEVGGYHNAGTPELRKELKMLIDGGVDLPEGDELMRRGLAGGYGTAKPGGVSPPNPGRVPPPRPGPFVNEVNQLGESTKQATRAFYAKDPLRHKEAAQDSYQKAMTLAKKHSAEGQTTSAEAYYRRAMAYHPDTDQAFKESIQYAKDSRLYDKLDSASFAKSYAPDIQVKAISVNKVNDVDSYLRINNRLNELQVLRELTSQGYGPNGVSVQQIDRYIVDYQRFLKRYPWTQSQP